MNPSSVVADVASNVVAVFGGVVALTVALLTYLGNKEGRRDRAQIHETIGDSDANAATGPGKKTPPLIDQIVTLTGEIGAVRKEFEDCKSEFNDAIVKIADLEEQLGDAQVRVTDLESQIAKRARTSSRRGRSTGTR